MRGFALDNRAAALAIRRGLHRQVLRVRDVELLIEDRVARRVFVHIRRAMPDPLPRHKDRQLYVVLDLAHLERRRMAVAHQIIDQPLVLTDLAGAAAVGDAGRLHDRRVVAHVIDDADKPVIENGNRLVKDRFERRHRGTARLMRCALLRSDFLLLLCRQPPHRPARPRRSHAMRTIGSPCGNVDKRPLNRSRTAGASGNSS